MAYNHILRQHHLRFWHNVAWLPLSNRTSHALFAHWWNQEDVLNHMPLTLSLHNKFSQNIFHTYVMPLHAEIRQTTKHDGTIGASEFWICSWSRCDPWKFNNSSRRIQGLAFPNGKMSLHFVVNLHCILAKAKFPGTRLSWTLANRKVFSGYVCVPRISTYAIYPRIFLCNRSGHITLNNSTGVLLCDETINGIPMPSSTKAFIFVILSVFLLILIATARKTESRNQS